MLSWEKFDIAPGEVTNFHQPNASAVAINKILQQDPSKILGALNATVTTGDVQKQLVSPDGQWVAYLTSELPAGIPKLLAKRVDGTGSALQLNAPLLPGKSILSFAFTPDSARVIYLAQGAAF